MEDIETYGFLIEDEDELAERLGGEIVEIWGRESIHLPQENYKNFTIFQYMIGNTDWKIGFLHNIAMVQLKEDTTQLLVIPYDFDYSGLVDSYYGIPNPNLVQLSIKQRLCFSKLKMKQI